MLYNKVKMIYHSRGLNFFVQYSMEQIDKSLRSDIKINDMTICQKILSIFIIDERMEILHIIYEH